MFVWLPVWDAVSSLHTGNWVILSRTSMSALARIEPLNISRLHPLVTDTKQNRASYFGSICDHRSCETLSLKTCGRNTHTCFLLKSSGWGWISEAVWAFGLISKQNWIQVSLLKSNQTLTKENRGKPSCWIFLQSHLICTKLILN